MSFPLLGLTRDFHPLECAHAGRTKKQPMQELLENIIYLLGTLVYSMASIFEQFHHSFTAVINLIMVAGITPKF